MSRSSYWLRTIVWLVVVSAIGIFVYLASSPAPAFAPSDAQRLTIGAAEISVTVADNPEEQTRGLSGVAQLPEGRGMLFSFPDSVQRTFWMKGMLFPLDFIWANDGVVIGFTADVPAPATAQATPSVIKSHGPVNYVIEVNAGFVRRHDIKVGDLVAYR